MKNYLGSVFTFYLGNAALTQGNNPFYMYQVESPGLDENCEPLVTINKIGEWTTGSIPSADRVSMHSEQLLQYLNKGKKDKPKDVVDQLKKMMIYDEDRVTSSEKCSFPAWELDNNLTKNIITLLRDALRWKSYSFQPGRLIDVLTSPTEVTVCRICGNSSDLYLEAVESYSTSDPCMKNPKGLRENLHYPKSHFTGASELNKAIRQSEWKALG